MKNRMLVLVPCVITLVLSFGYSDVQSAKTDGTIKLAVVGAHSGDLAMYGQPTLNTAQMIADEINSAGGINGRMIEIITEDDQCRPELAARAAVRMVNAGVIAVIGHTCSGATKSALETYRNTGIPCISPSATNPPLTQSGRYPNFFRTISSDDAQAKLGSDFMSETLHLKTIAILHDKGDYGKEYAEMMMHYAESSGMSVVLFKGVNPGQADYSEVIEEIRTAAPDGVVWGGYYPEAAILVTQMRDTGLAIPFISDDGVKIDQLIQIAGLYAEGVYATAPKDKTRLPMALAADRAYKKRFGEEPGPFFYEAYAALQALINAIKIADSDDSTTIAEVLRSQYVNTVLGRISFDESGEVIGYGFSMWQVVNGQFKDVQTE